MDYQSAFAISAAGMSAEKLRADVAALNPVSYTHLTLPTILLV